MDIAATVHSPKIQQLNVGLTETIQRHRKPQSSQAHHLKDLEEIQD